MSLIDTIMTGEREPELNGRNILVLNWRDMRHPQAGGAEQYLHRIALHWIAAGATVTWMTARFPGSAAREVVDGIEVLRAGGALGVYARTALRLVRRGRRFDAIVDCQNGIPFFAPAFAGRRVPVVQVVHHVHQDQFATRFSPAIATVGRLLEGPVARRVYGSRAIAAVSASTRHELRRRLGFPGPIFIVPNGTGQVRWHERLRDPDPTIVLVTRLVPHKRIDLFLRQLILAERRPSRLRVEIIGDGPELVPLRRLARDLGLTSTVTLHGRQPDSVRDELLSLAWLTVSTSAAEGWGCSVVEAASWGVPCVGLAVPGIRDSVVDGRTGWLAEDVRDFPDLLMRALDELADDDTADRIGERCRAWAGCFTWERSARLLAGVIAHEAGRSLSIGRRRARSDLATLVRFEATSLSKPDARLRVTDEISVRDGRVSALLGGCDEFDALGVLGRLGVPDADVRIANRHDLLAGPDGLPAELVADPAERT